MTNPHLVRYANKLDTLFQKAQQLSHDLELQSHWARYLCVLVCGFLETGVRTTYGHYARSRAHPNVARYANKKLELFRSPTMGNILELTSLFSKEWAEDLERDTDGELKDAVNSIVAVRHQIAHGNDTGISYVRVREYHRSIVKVIDLLEQQCR